MNKTNTDSTSGILEPQPPLVQKVSRGTLWLTGAKAIAVILGLVRTTILARLLSPDDFGLLGIALLGIAVLERLSQSGFEKALIQRKEDISGFLDTAWIIAVLRGTTLSAVLFFSAPLIADFYGSPAATLILKVMAASFLLRGLTNIGVVYFKKDMLFNKQFLLHLSEAITLLVVSISLAFMLKNVWALVWGMFAGILVQVVVSYIIHPYRPGLNLSLKKARELFSFGSWIYFSSILVLLFTYGGNAFVGKILGVASLGFYALAYRYSNLAGEIAPMISQVTFPAFSKMQTDLKKIREAYWRVLQTVVFISLPLAGAIFALSAPFVKVFLGDKWLPIVGAMRVLCIVAALRVILNTYGSLFAGIGKPQEITKIAAINVVVLALAIYPLTLKFGIAGTASALALSFSASTTYGTWKAHHIVGIPYFKFGKTIMLPGVGVVAFCIIVMLLQRTSFFNVGILSFGALAVFSAIIYLVAIFLLDKLFDYDITGLGSLLLKGFGFKKSS